jgi:hypothetical protein
MRSLGRARDLLVSNYGRADGWFVELDDKRVAELTGVRSEDMFWDSYEVASNSHDDGSQIRDDALWHACRFSFRNRRTGELVATAFCGGTAPFVRDGRVRIRGLYLRASTAAERVCLAVLRLLRPKET